MQINTINTAPVKQAPALAVDAGHTLRLEGKIERRIVWNLISQLWDAGFAVVAVDDGEDRVRCAKAESPALAAMEAAFAVDECYLIVKPKSRKHSGEHWIKLVGGNGEDIVSDWGYNTGDPDGFNAFMEAFNAAENY